MVGDNLVCICLFGDSIRLIIDKEMSESVGF